MRVIVPLINPFPVLDAVIVTVFTPANNLPDIMLRLATLTLFSRVILLAEPLLIVTSLKVVAPEIVTSFVPVSSSIVDEPEVNVPLLFKLPLMVCEKEPALKPVAEPMVRSPLIVSPVLGVFVPPLVKLRILKVLKVIVWDPDEL